MIPEDKKGRGHEPEEASDEERLGFGGGGR